MKKMCFSAVALIAFALPSFANDIADKSVVVVEENCSEVYSNEKKCYMEEEGLTEKEAKKKAEKAYYDCRQRNYDERQQEKIKAFERL